MAESMATDQISINLALNIQRSNVFQVMGILRMAAGAIREPPLGQRSITDAWTALDGAYTLLSSVADRLEDTQTLLAEHVEPGEY